MRLLLLALPAAALLAVPASAHAATRVCGPLPGGSWCYDTTTGDLSCHFTLGTTHWVCA